MNKEEVVYLCKELSRKMKVEMPRIRFQNMKKKWASCSIENKILTLDKKVFELSSECVRYILIHELLHLKIPRHNKLFRIMLSVYHPEWEDVHQKIVSIKETKQ